MTRRRGEISPGSPDQKGEDERKESDEFVGEVNQEDDGAILERDLLDPPEDFQQVGGW